MAVQSILCRIVGGAARRVTMTSVLHHKKCPQSPFKRFGFLPHPICVKPSFLPARTVNMFSVPFYQSSIAGKHARGDLSHQIKKKSLFPFHERTFVTSTTVEFWKRWKGRWVGRARPSKRFFWRLHVLSQSDGRPFPSE
ncbi:hypothetical protein PISMIDRAFT_441409 [Pisolithus microcarpus 441]|uniref:Uncharacterized protein n=1 Tax=Pisolithus microcarpus 441 TaxID=765257 RepID=A0A0C9ZKB8_9AGAM|nr:hypothetical protein PISMIDRAFT_441409 [Pisolithus microcarpus 441]